MIRALTAIAALAAFVALIVPAVAQQTGSQPTGIFDTWSGKIDQGQGSRLRIVVKVTAGANGGPTTATVAIGDDDATDTPIDTVSYAEPNLTWRCAALDCSFSGALDSFSRAVVGTLTYHGTAIRLVLARAEKIVSSGFTRLSDANSFLVGTWDSTVVYGGTTYKSTFQISTNATGGLIATFVSITSNSPPLAADLRYRNGRLRLTIDDISASYTGQPGADKSTIDGTFDYQGTQVPMTLIRRAAQ